ILVVSAYDDDVYVQGLLGVGVDGYHLKDQPLSDLRLAVQRVIAGERWISSSLLDKLLNPSSSLLSLPALSTRQKELLRLLSKGADNRTIAAQLHLSVKTVENHLTRLYRQLNVQSRLEAANYAREHPELTAHVNTADLNTPPSGTQYANRQTSSFVDMGRYEDAAEQGAILVVDDNKRYRYQLRRTIGKVYPQAMVFEAESSGEMLQIIQRVQPRVAFVDVVLGDEDGISCVRKLKAALPLTRIILISAYPDREFHRRGLEAGATAFVDKKDLDAATLSQIIHDALA
ncbi:MAG: response regulator, partial [Anaerolineales bacterium]|nr:response regulator [Anaerolineales bacterium]